LDRSAAQAPPTTAPWWERGWVAALLVVLSAVPLLRPALPPLTDLPGHMARWHVSTVHGLGGPLDRYFDFSWAIVGNLGMDLIVPALARLTGLEPASKIAVIAIPVITAAGMLWVAREVHGRTPPAAFFALPLAYAWPFQFGFVNFTLAQGLAFCALALWIRLGRQERFVLRAALFVPIAAILWLAHLFGWGMFGLMAFGAELARERGVGQRWARAIVRAAGQCLPLAPPLLFMLLAGSGSSGAPVPHELPDPRLKVLWIATVLRDRWRAYDLVCALIVCALLYRALRSRDRLLGFAPALGLPALFCAAAFLLLPWRLAGGAHVDMRLLAPTVALALLALRYPAASLRQRRILALAALAFFAVRTAAMTVSFALRGAEQQSELAAIAHIPRGSTVLALVQKPCRADWGDSRRDHLPGFAIIRRDAFTNEQWDLEGQQLLKVRYTAGGRWRADPSQLVFDKACLKGNGFAGAIATFPRVAFAYVWTIGFPPGAARARDLKLVWGNRQSALYRVVRVTAPETIS
jgi:hypothetical protein